MGLLARAGFAWVKWKSRHGLRDEGAAARGGNKHEDLRVGVRGERYVKGERDLGDYVLEPFARAERELFEETIGRAVEALQLWLTRGIDSAMMRANQKPSSPGGASRPD